VLDHPAQYGRRGVPALVGVLLDIGIAGVVVDHAVQVDVADPGPLLGAGQVTNAAQASVDLVSAGPADSNRHLGFSGIQRLI
jgi:hypothetical protein